ncbi:glycoside hydrolase family protein [Azospirillum palustre]
MTKPVCAAAVALVKHFEGLYLKAYLCPAGVPTIGYGHTDGVRLGQTITEAQADAFLAADLAEAAADVDRYVKVPLTDDQRGALASFVFNLGPGNLASSTLLRKLNVGDAAGAAAEFGQWVKATVKDPETGEKVKKTLPGLVSRRAAEQALFSGGVVMLPIQPPPMPQAVHAPAGPDSDRVTAIQRIVGVTPDGHYGPVTRAAVTLWQAQRHLVADGVVGPRTAAAMGL